MNMRGIRAFTIDRNNSPFHPVSLSPRLPFSPSPILPHNYFHCRLFSFYMTTPGPILLFDGVCNLCNGLVRFIVKRDQRGKIRFAPLQSTDGHSLRKKFNQDSDDIDTIFYINGSKYFIKSVAVLHILKDIGRGWQLFYVFIIIPKFIRDFVYDLIARTRYRIFGKTDTCMVPDEDINERFLF